MTIDEFRKAEPRSFPAPLQALWLDGNDDWEQAHTVAQDVEGTDGAWVHAYLHRKEGDVANAAYWYRRAGHPVASGDLSAEWEAMVLALLGTKRDRR